MTSKSLFIKLQKEDLKRRIWSIALAILIFFVVLPVFCALNLDDYAQYDEEKRIIENILNFMGPSNIGVFIVTIACAIVCGISGFYFLHSKKKVDFYHSLPVRRETLFAVCYINGFLIYFLPYILNMIICFGVLKVNNYLNNEIFLAAISAILINAVFYGLIYTIVIIAVMLTGNFIVSGLGTAVFLLYGPTVMMVKEMYFRYFYKTYYTDTRLEKCFEFLSPIGIYLGVIERWANKGNLVISIIITIAVTIILSIFANILYHKRPSEAAGKAMAFHIAKPIIKIMLVILLTLGGGVLFRGTVSNNYDGWLIFGLIFSLIIISAVVEIIFNFDIRSAFRHKKQMAACIIVIGAIVAIFRLDVFHFDTYLPKEDNIKYMSVAISGVNSNINYVEFINDKVSHSNSTNYQLKYMTLSDFKTAYELAELGIATLGDSKEMDSYDRAYNYCVKYTLKNGKEVYRNYTMETDSSYELLSNLFSKEEFKEAHYPINQWTEGEIGKISLRYASQIINDSEFGMDGKEGFDLNLTSQEKKKFISTYKEELNAMSLDELATNTPIISMQVEVNKYDFSDYCIYPSFTETLALIEAYGFDSSKTVKAENVIELYVTDYRPNSTTVSDSGLNAKAVDQSEPLQVTYTDREDIARILTSLVQREYYYNNHAIIEIEGNIDVSLNVFNRDYNQGVNYTYQFKKGEIPDFVQEALKLK